MTRFSIDRIEAATDLIDGVFQNTPQYVCTGLSAILGCSIVLKVETLNPVRCFKGRGTETILSRLDRNGDSKSVVCASTGNLGQALAYSGRNKGFDVTVTASSAANPLQVKRMRVLGAHVVLVDGQIEEALEAALDHSDKTGAFVAGRVVESGPPSTIADGVAGRYTIPDVLTDLLEVADEALLVKE